MNEIRITALPEAEWCIVKYIRVSKGYHDAYIMYRRRLSTTYCFPPQEKATDAKTRFNNLLTGIPQESYPEDGLDQSIFNAIKEQYPNASVFNKLIIFDTEKEDVKKWTGLYVKEEAQFTIMPIINDIKPNGQYHGYRTVLDIFIEHNCPIFSNESYQHSVNPNEIDLYMNNFSSNVINISDWD